MYEVRILRPAVRELERLDRAARRRVVTRIHWLAKNVESMRLTALKGPLRGLYKLRCGDYRVVYEILQEERLIVVHAIGHRGDIYR